MASCIHSGALGDIIFAIPLMRKLHIDIIYIPSVTDTYYKDNNIPMSQMGYMEQLKCRSIKPLLEFLGFTVYIFDWTHWESIKVDYNLDIWYKFWSPGPDPMKFQNIFFEFYFDQRKPWLTNLPVIDDKYDIIINRTERYQNPYSLENYLKIFKDDIKIGFIGFGNEFEMFQKLTDKHIEKIQINNFLEIASYINSSRLFIGNSSSCYAIAEGIKTTPYIHEKSFHVDLESSNERNISIKSNKDIPRLWEFIESNNLMDIVKV